MGKKEMRVRNELLLRPSDQLMRIATRMESYSRKKRMDSEDEERISSEMAKQNH